MDVLVIGAGPAGLMAAEVLASRGRQVTIFDSKPSFGRKFLMAGKSGLNITKEESFNDFMANFKDDREKLEPILQTFGPEKIKDWVLGLGQEIFFGSTLFWIFLAPNFFLVLLYFGFGTKFFFFGEMFY